MPDPGWWGNFLEILKYIFGDNLPFWVMRTFAMIAIILFILAVIYVIVFFMTKIINLFLETIFPLFHNKTEKRQALRCKNFARNLYLRIRDLNDREDWMDNHFTELEAEVEVEGRIRPFTKILNFLPSREGKRRVKSLTRALEISAERILLLEGDPGSGKSVALRHLSLSMLDRASKSRSSSSIIPLYINLKELRRNKNETIDTLLIERFVTNYLAGNSNRDDEKYLSEEFQGRKENGQWLFIFDSFDEIPDILSATEANEIIRQYSSALFEFLHGQNTCRGIIASRHFRGPGQVNWPRMKITPLSKERKIKLIRRANLALAIEKKLISQLILANQDIQNMASNPMFLGLLCQHVDSGFDIPRDTHVLFDSYVEARLSKDQERVQRHFGIDITRIREEAEKIAFCMTAESGLGLTPTRQELQKGMENQRYEWTRDHTTILDALEYMKLARYGLIDNRQKGEGQTFTFAHRRFQEYFATCVVLHQPDKVTHKELLSNARWRETAVVLCQTQSAEALRPLIQAIRQGLNEILEDIPSNFPRSTKELMEYDEKEGQSLMPFPWPDGCLHLLGIAQEGFNNRLKDLPTDIRNRIGKVLLQAYKMGGLFDRRWSLEVIGAAPEAIKISLLESAVSSSSVFLHEASFHQLSRLGRLSPAIVNWIRQSLVRQAIKGELRKQWQETNILISRLDHSSDLIHTARLLRIGKVVDVLAIIFLLVPFVWSLWTPQLTLFSLAFIALLIIAFKFTWIGGFVSHFSEEDQITILSLLPFFSITIRLVSGVLVSSFYLQFGGVVQINITERMQSTLTQLVILPISFFIYILLLACLDGFFSKSSFLWIFIPLSPFSFLIHKILELYRELPRLVSFLKDRPVIFGIISFFVVLMIIMITIVNFFDTFYGSKIPATPPPANIKDAMIFLSLIILCSLGYAIFYFRNWNKLRKTLGVLEVKDMIDTCFKHNLYMMRLLKYVRRKQLLVADKNSEIYLTYLILLVENTIKKRNSARKDQLKSYSELFSTKPAWDFSRLGEVDLNHIPKEHKLVARKLSEIIRSDAISFTRLCTNDRLDELGMLLDQVRMRSRTL